MHVHVGFCVIADYTSKLPTRTRNRTRTRVYIGPDLTSTIRATMNKMPNLVNVSQLRQPAQPSPFLSNWPPTASTASSTPPPAAPAGQLVECRTHRTHLQFKLNAHKLVVFPNSAATAFTATATTIPTLQLDEVPSTQSPVSSLLCRWQKCHLSYITNQVSSFPFRVYIAVAAPRTEIAAGT